MDVLFELVALSLVLFGVVWICAVMYDETQVQKKGGEGS